MIVFSRASIQGRSCLGRAAYPSSLGRDCPSVSAHQTNFTSAPALAGSSYCLWIRNHVKLAMGYALSPSGFVIDTRKSVLGSIAVIAPAAAAVTLSRAGVMNLPALLRTAPAGSLLIIAYPSST